MLLCLDVGNTHVFGGVFSDNKLITRFRCATHLMGTADQLGIFLIDLLRVKGINSKDISASAICSVVPSYDYTIKHMLALYFKTSIFILQPDVKIGLNIQYKNPNEVGADRIANAIGAIHLFPNKNIIIIDMGTATTLCAITKKRDYMGGAILPGLRLWMESLKSSTAKLMEVNIEIPTFHIGKTTRESIQGGLFYGQLGALKEIISGFKNEVFHNAPVVVIGTGGFAQLYKEMGLFEVILPDLVLDGLSLAYQNSIKT